MFDRDLFEQISASKAPQKLLIVPAQLTLSAEQAAFDVLGKGNDEFGFFDFHIMSGNKLRAEIMNKVGGPGRTAINSLGRSMILRKCARDAKLSVYTKLAASPEFLSAAADFIVQLKQNMSEIPGVEDGLLAGKLSDMSQIYRGYESFMQGKYMDSEDGLLFAAEKARSCDWIKQSEIWFAGFYSFTKREQAFIKALDESSFGCHIVNDSIQNKIPDSLSNIFEAGSRSEQALFIAAEILRLIREENYKADDIVILSGDIANDGPIIKRSFGALGIPVYTDEKRSLMHVDAAVKIANLLDIAADSYQSRNVVDYIANEEFEKYVNTYKIKGKAFLSPFKYGGEKKIEAEILRCEFAEKTVPFAEEFKKLKTVREKTQSLFYFLRDVLDMPGELHERSLQLNDDGYTDAADELAQCWDVIISVFDQAVELLGDEEISNAEYRDIIKGAFKDIKIGLLPQKSGCIVLGDIYRTKLSSVKVLFVSSFNDSCIPRNNDAEGILTEAEQRRLADAGYVLCKSYEQLNKEDKECIFRALSEASEKLYLSYSLSDSEGRLMHPSYLLRNADSSKIIKERSDLYSLEELIEKLRDYKAGGEALGSVWKAVAAVRSHDARYNAAITGLLYKNEDKYLSSESRDKILKPAEASTSGIEKYARCPYSYFMSYGIKPEEQDEFKIDKRMTGTIHHEILMRLARFLSSDGKPVSAASSKWNTVSDEEITAFVESCVADIQENDSSGLLTKGAEEEYRTERIKRLASSFALQMVKQVRLGNIDKIVTEKEFSLSFAGCKLKGKIDRIDITSLSDRELVKIIDYKSGKTSFDKSLALAGLDLQLMIYLEAASGGGEQPIGSFYFHIENPTSSVELERLSEIAEEQLFKLDGAYVDDNVIYIDKHASGGAASEVLKAKQKMSNDEYEALRTAFRNKLSTTVSKLCSGDISVKPHRLAGSNSSCTYCPYNTICSFDNDTEGFSII